MHLFTRLVKSSKHEIRLIPTQLYWCLFFGWIFYKFSNFNKVHTGAFYWLLCKTKIRERLLFWPPKCSGQSNVIKSGNHWSNPIIADIQILFQEILMKKKQITELGWFNFTRFWFHWKVRLNGTYEKKIVQYFVALFLFNWQ